MKKLYYFLIFVFIFCNNFYINAQIKTLEKSFPLLTVSKDKFINDLEFFTSNIENKSDLIYEISINRDSLYELYLVTLNLLPLDMISEDTCLGVFYSKDVPFVVKKGCNPGSLFKKNKDNENCLISMPINEIIIKEEFSFWFFLFDGVKLIHIDLPSFYIKRLGFIPCS